MAATAAALYALNSPISRLLLNGTAPAVMAALLYLGAGVGILTVRLVQKQTGIASKEQPLSQKDLPYAIGMVLPDISRRSL